MPAPFDFGKQLGRGMNVPAQTGLQAGAALGGLAGAGVNTISKTIGQTTKNFGSGIAKLMGGGGAQKQAPQDLRPMSGSFIRSKEQDKMMQQGQVPGSWSQDPASGQIRPMVMGP